LMSIIAYFTLILAATSFAFSTKVFTSSSP
jgi:hypothetical protein